MPAIAIESEPQHVGLRRDTVYRLSDLLVQGRSVVKDEVVATKDILTTSVELGTIFILSRVVMTKGKSGSSKLPPKDLKKAKADAQEAARKIAAERDIREYARKQADEQRNERIRKANEEKNKK